MIFTDIMPTPAETAAGCAANGIRTIVGAILRYKAVIITSHSAIAARARTKSNEHRRVAQAARTKLCSSRQANEYPAYVKDNFLHAGRSFQKYVIKSLLFLAVKGFGEVLDICKSIEVPSWLIHYAAQKPAVQAR